MKPAVMLIAISDIKLDAVEKEVSLIRQESLGKASRDGYIRIVQEPYVNFGSLTSALAQKEYFGQVNILHYTGHSSRDSLLIKENGVEKGLGSFALEVLVSSHGRFQLVFLNSCYSEEIAKKLVALGVPYVIGSLGGIYDEDSAIVAAKFYEFLGRGVPTTVQDAFDLTNAYFKDKPEKLKRGGVFRSLDTGDFRESNVWILCRGEKLTDEQKKWSLMPQYNHVLTNADEKARRVMCLYRKSEDNRRIYEALRAMVRSEVAINGLWELFSEGVFDLDEFKKELYHADSVIHLIDGPEYLNEPYLVKELEEKGNAWLPVRSIDMFLDFFEGRLSWFKGSAEISSDNPVFGKSVEETLEFFGRRNSSFNESFALTNYKTTLLSFLDGSSAGLNANLVLEDLSKIEIIEADKFNDAYYRFKKPVCNFVLLEGTNECAQKLVVRRIRDKAYATGTNAMIINSKNVSSDVYSIWKEIHRVLQAIEPRKSVLEAYREACLNTIFDRLKAESICFVFEEVYGDFNVRLSEVMDVILAEVNDLQVSSNNSLMFFFVNAEHMVGSIASSSILSSSIYYSYSPLIKMDPRETSILWSSLSKKYKYRGAEVEFNCDIPRGKFMRQVCDRLKVKTDNTLSAILRYDL